MVGHQRLKHSVVFIKHDCYKYSPGTVFLNTKVVSRDTVPLKWGKIVEPVAACSQFLKQLLPSKKMSGKSVLKY